MDVRLDWMNGATLFELDYLFWLEALSAADAEHATTSPSQLNTPAFEMEEIPESPVLPALRLVNKEGLDQSKPVYICYICESVFVARADLDSHYTSVHKSKDQPKEACPICGDKFTTSVQAGLHYRIAHPSAKRYRCFYCRAGEFRTRELCKAHIYTRHCVHCAVCGEMFSSVDRWNNHMVIHPGMDYTCKFCGIDFETYTGRLNHQRRSNCRFRPVHL